MAIKLKELPPVLVRSYLAKSNVMLRGKPAIGKTETIEAFAEKMRERVENFKVWRFYAPTMSPMDIQGSAPDYERGVLRLFNNEALPNAYQSPDAVGVVFFGEMPNADSTTLKLLQKYANGEDMSGTLRKPAGVIVIADGNRLEDKSGVQQQGRAFWSRFEQHEVYTDANDNIEFASKADFHPFVQTFFREHPECIDNYDEVFQLNGAPKNAGTDRMSEEGKIGIWANMRAWERISNKEKAAEQIHSPLTLDEMIGNLGQGVGTAYNAHKAMLGKLASFDEVMANPDSVTIPEKMDEKYALCMVVALRAKEDQLDNVHTFGKRMPLELQAVILRYLASRKNFDLAGSTAYVNWISNGQLIKLINGR